jgi:hypothetical protein
MIFTLKIKLIFYRLFCTINISVKHLVKYPNIDQKRIEIHQK